MACSLPSGLTARLAGGHLGMAGAGSRCWCWPGPSADWRLCQCASSQPAQRWRLQPALRPPLPPLLGTTTAAPPAPAAALVTQTCTHHHQPHEPAPSSTQGHGATLPLPLPPPSTQHPVLQLNSQHGEAATLQPMLFLVTAKTFDQVYIPLLNIPLH